MKFLLITCVATLGLAATAHAAVGDKVTAQLKGDGITGTVEMIETASGAIHIIAKAKGVPQGTHGFHVHESGTCDAAQGFKSAGGHLAGDLKHGIDMAGGPHPGDLPNVHVQSDGILDVEYFTYGFTLGASDDPSIEDKDGSAVILHAGADDYTSQPSGDAGSRIACGVLKAAP